MNVTVKDVPNMNATPRESANGHAVVRMIGYNEHGDVTQGRQTTPRRVTYLGVPAISWEVREAGASGTRTYYTWWLEDAKGQPTEWPAGTVTAHTVRGNRDRGTLKVITDNHIVKLDGIPAVS